MSVYISNLPLYTGNTYNGYIIWNDSGETTTYKTLYIPQFKAGIAANSIVAHYLPTSSGNGIKSLVGGGTTTYSNNDHSIVWGENCYISQNTQFANAVFGRNSKVTGGSGGSMVYGSDCTMTGSYSLVGGEQSNCYGNNTGVFGRGHQSYVGRGFVTGNVNNVTGDGDTCMGDQHSMNNGGTDTYNGIFGGRLNRLNNSLYSSILGGYGNGLSGVTSSSSDYIYGASIIGGSGHTLNGNFNFIAGGSNNSIRLSTYSSIINGSGNTITGMTNAQMIGCNNRTATTSGATFVENLVVFNYSNLNYADDTAAAAGGVVLGQVYHNAGALRIRIV